MRLCPNGPYTRFEPVQQSRQQAFRAFCPNIYLGSAPLLSLLSSVMIWKTVKRTECITKTKAVVQIQVKHKERSIRQIVLDVQSEKKTLWAINPWWWLSWCFNQLKCYFLMTDLLRALTEIQIIAYDRRSIAPFLLNLVADVLFALFYFIVSSLVIL